MSDERVLKADMEDGYGRVANLLLEALAISKVSGKQMSILMFIIRRTYSWRKKSDEITLKEFAAACDSSESYMSRQLNQLINWKVVTRKNYSPGKTPEYEINTRVAEWDKSCLNVKGLSENTRQGLYKQTSQPLNKRTKQPLSNCSGVVQGSSIENTGIELCPKESSKESTTTTTSITGEKSKGEKRVKDSVADMDADSIQQNKQNLDLGKIEDFYKREIRQRATCSGTDLMHITKTYEKYKDADFILSVMAKAKEDYIARHGKLNINSFSYFESIFEERWQLLHEKKEGTKVKQPAKRNYRPNKYQANKTRFHNFEQRSDGYSENQLEDIVARKRREHIEKMNRGKTAL